MAQTVYVVDLWDKFSPDKVISKHKINKRWWAIKEVSLEWGIPQLAKIDNDEFITYKLYNTKEEAEAYIRALKRWEGI